jgi:hydroxymethylpyrimidine pyrophosphatase-like HAD family hydrolase
MDIRAMVFDIDGTLTPLGQPLKREISKGLCTLEQRGYRVGFASGKPCPYIEGFVRAIGLQNYFAFGENGAVYLDNYIGVITPLAKRCNDVDKLETQLGAISPLVYFQNNLVMLSVLSEDDDIREKVFHSIKDQGWPDREDAMVYFHSHSADVLPAGVDKGTAIAYLKQRNGWDTSQVLAVGDSINDEPMKREAVFYAVGSDIDAELSFENGVEMIRYLLDCFLPL